MLTETDRGRNKVLEHVNCAIKELSKIVIDEAEGYYDYTSDYRNELSESLTQLIKIREKIGLKD